MMTHRFCVTALENDCFTKSNSLTCFKEQEKKTVYVATIHAAVPHFKAKLVSVLSRIMVQLKLVIILIRKVRLISFIRNVSFDFIKANVP